MSPSDATERRKHAAMAGYRNDAAGASAAVDDDDPGVRVAGLRSLDRLGQLSDSTLHNALQDAASTVRIAALELAATRPAPAIAGLLDDPDPMVVESAAWALGERVTADTAVIDRLVTVAGEHDDPLARESAVAALGAIGDDRGLPAILAATTDKPAVRRRAVVALAAFDGPEVDAAWQRARNDRDRQVRDAVDELLGPEEPDEET